MKGSIHVRSFIKIAHFIPARQHGRYGEFWFLIGWNIEKSSFSETASPTKLTFDKRPKWKVFCNISSFRTNLSTNMAAMGDFSFWLVIIEKNLVLWNRLTNDTDVWQETSMRGPMFSHTIPDSSDLIIQKKIFFSETAWPTTLIFDRKHLWEVFC